MAKTVRVKPSDVYAARLRVAANKRLGRTSEAWLQRLADVDVSSSSKGRASVSETDAEEPLEADDQEGPDDSRVTRETWLLRQRVADLEADVARHKAEVDELVANYPDAVTLTPERLVDLEEDRGP